MGNWVNKIGREIILERSKELKAKPNSAKKMFEHKIKLILHSKSSYICQCLNHHSCKLTPNFQKLKGLRQPLSAPRTEPEITTYSRKVH